MAARDFPAAFAALRSLLAGLENMRVQADTADEYSLVSRVASPFAQHKGQAMWFGAVRTGKTCVSFHLMPLYMNPALSETISPALKKRMRGKTCFGFLTAPEPELRDELQRLTEASVAQWSRKKWL